MNMHGDDHCFMVSRRAGFTCSQLRSPLGVRHGCALAHMRDGQPGTPLGCTTEYRLAFEQKFTAADTCCAPASVVTRGITFCPGADVGSQIRLSRIARVPLTRATAAREDYCAAPPMASRLLFHGVTSRAHPFTHGRILIATRQRRRMITRPPCAPPVKCVIAGDARLLRTG